MCSLLTHSYYLIGIHTRVIYLRDVPEENKTYNLCFTAIYYNGYALKKLCCSLIFNYHSNVEANAYNKE
jgi:hypothetical protein